MVVLEEFNKILKPKKQHKNLKHNNFKKYKQEYYIK